MTTTPRIPRAVCVVVGDVLGLFYYSHRVLNGLFIEAGAPGDPPEGNCAEKCSQWLKRASDDPNVDALKVLGEVLEEFMEVDASYKSEDQSKGRDRINKVFASNGMTYLRGGIISAPGIGSTARTLEQIIQKRDLPALDVEHRRAIESITTDPPAALTASCAILEALFKVYIGDEGLPLPKDQTIKSLWEVVRKHIGFDPVKVEEEDLKKILGGLASIVDGIGAFRTHASSAHGRGRLPYKVGARHARLAVNASYTVATFVLETWDGRKKGRS